MSEVPSNWKTVGLLDISMLVRGVTYTKNDASEVAFDGSTPVLRANNIQDRKFVLSDLVYVPNSLVSEAQQIGIGDVVVATSSGSINIVGKAAQARVDMQAGFGAFCALLRPCSEVNAKYFGHYFSTDAYRMSVSAMARGVNINNLKKDHFEKLVFPLAPLKEQKRIADKLDSILARVDACRERLDRIPAILKRFRQAVLAAATSGKLTEEWRANKLAQQSHESNQMKTGRVVLNTVQVKKNEWVETNLNHNEAERVRRRLSKFSAELITQNNLPDNWCWAKLEDVSLFVVDCHNKTAPYEKTGIALVRTSNIRDGNFIWDDLRYVSEATYKYWSKRCYPEAGDVVFTREAPLGEAAIIPADKKICLGQRTMLIRTVEEYYLAKFLLISLMDPKFKSRSEVVAVGTGVKHFRVGDVSDLIVPVPSTEEQTEIVRRVEELFAYADRIEARYHAARLQVNKLTLAVLAKAFRGELVPQDPSDEPASVLLDRIRAYRAENAVTPKPKRSPTITSRKTPDIG